MLLIAPRDEVLVREVNGEIESGEEGVDGGVVVGSAAYLASFTGYSLEFPVKFQFLAQRARHPYVGVFTNS